jgi:hypothetical protein
MTITNLVSTESIKKILGKIYEKIPKLTDDDYGTLLYQTEITNDEVCILKANAILHAIDRISVTDSIPDYVADRLKKENAWIYTWHITHDLVEGAMDHLKGICDYHLKYYAEPYCLDYLKTFEQDYWERICEKHQKQNKRSYRKKFDYNNEDGMD